MATPWALHQPSVRHSNLRMRLRPDIYASVFDNAVQAIILINTSGNICDANPAAERMFGYSRQELLDQNVSVLMSSPYSQEHDRYMANYLETGDAQIIGVGREVVARHRDGSEFAIELAVSEVVVDGAVFFVGMISDITERKESDYLLDMNYKVMRAINGALGGFINSNVGKRDIFESLLEKLLDITKSEYGFIGEILQKDDQAPYLKTFAITNVAWNRETRKLYKENVRSGLEFRNLDTLFGFTIRTGEVVISNDPAADPRSGGLPRGHPSLDAYLGLPLYSGNKLIGMAGIANRASGYDEDLADLLKPLLGTIGSLIAGYQNMSLRRKAEQELYRAQAKLRQMATQDPLTGIANRKSLFDQLEDVFTRSREMGHDFSLLFVDIDHFKRINDSFGHKAGDKALQQTVAILQNNMRPGDIFGRYGGEELIVGLLDCDLEDARRSAERIRKAVEHASIDLDHEREPLNITVSIGMVTATADIPDIDALVHSADQAAYAAKKAGRNRVHAYDA